LEHAKEPYNEIHKIAQAKQDGHQIDDYSVMDNAQQKLIFCNLIFLLYEVRHQHLNSYDRKYHEYDKLSTILA
jgi:hypothetical protein